MPTEIDWVRLAAFIDGEGMIDIHTHRQFRKDLGRLHETLYVRIIIVNTDPRLALWCKNTFGGTANLDRKSNPKWRNCLKWYCSSKKAAEILRGCLPYFLLKREQAELALIFQETVTHSMGRKGHTPETHNRRLDIQQKMKLLKRAQSIPSDYIVH